MKTETEPFWSDVSIRGIEKTIKNKGKILIISNKKAYANWTICNQCWYVIKCKHCDIPIAYHQTSTYRYTMCHICKKEYIVQTECPQCHSTNLNQYGLGTEQIDERFQKNYKQKSYTLTSSEVSSLKKIKTSIKKIQQSTIIISTSIAIQRAKKIDIDLVVISNADQWLHTPDYESHAKTFHQIHDCIKSYKNTPNIIIQSHNVNHPSIRYACQQNIQWFQERDKDFREHHHYPPQGEIAVIMYKNEIEKKVFSTTNKLYQELLYLKNKANNSDIELYATPPLIYKMYDKYRYHVIIKGKSIRKFLDQVYEKLYIQKRWFKVDRQAKELI